ITYTWQQDGGPIVCRPGSVAITDTHDFWWDTPGAHTITVTAANAGGAVTDTHLVTVCDGLAPALAADPTSGPAPLQVAFTNLTSGEPTDLWWDFGDGATSTAANPVHTYLRPGTYTVTLHVANACEERVLALPGHVTVLCGGLQGVALEGPTTGVPATRYAFTATVSPLSAAGPITYAWEAGGQPLITRTAGLSDAMQLSWPSPGTYWLGVAAWNECAVACTATHTITICQPLTAAFTATPTSGQAPLEVAFSDLSSGHEWLSWDFGDRGTSQEANPAYRYTSPGVYTVTLTVGNACGQAAETKRAHITVTAPPLHLAWLPLVVRG
ncbi:MAG: PKD domain-containing protein, partial [Anaerolineae bacterium]|nr:PKD domain-containing protein [Anaerolineae bacterium]